MPGYILHLTEAKLICERLEKCGVNLNQRWKNLFYLGNLLPDTKRKTDKITSHFWDPKSTVRLAIPPDLTLFEEKYGAQVQGPLMLGYQTHLRLDADYVEDYWDHILEFRDASGNTAVLKQEITSVWLKLYQKEIPVDSFFSSEYYYGDYSRMNGALLHKFQLEIPVYEETLACPVSEVNPEDLREVLEELEILCGRADCGGQEELRVFCLKDLEQFIREKARIEADYLVGLQKEQGNDGGKLLLSTIK